MSLQAYHFLIAFNMLHNPECEEYGSNKNTITTSNINTSNKNILLSQIANTICDEAKDFIGILFNSPDEIIQALFFSKKYNNAVSKTKVKKYIKTHYPKSKQKKIVRDIKTFTYCRCYDDN